jgi:hypothetical protein
MLQLTNRTPFEAEILPLANVEGIDSLFAVVKGTFALGETIRLADEQIPVTLTDEHHGEPPVSSIRRPSDLCLGKPGADVVLLGSAWAPGGRATWQMDVSISVGPVAKAVRVFGDRVWDTGPGGAAVAWVAPFERMPLVWERAFGGTHETEHGPVAHPRNPVGRGFRPSGSANTLRGLPMPNLEDPAAQIASPRDAPEPACFAPLAPHWEPRRSYAGTYDDRWQKTRAPYLPSDFNPRFFQMAPPSLIVPGYLQGDELVDVRGATPSGFLQFRLPALRIQVNYHVDGNVQSRPAVCDTLIVEPDEGRFVMVWRATLACDKQLLKVKEVETVFVDQTEVEVEDLEETEVEMKDVEETEVEVEDVEETDVEMADVED